MGQNQSNSGTTFPRQQSPLEIYTSDESFSMNFDDFNTMNRHTLFLHHPNGSSNSILSGDSYLASPSSIASAESFETSSDMYSPVTADGFFPQFSDDWASMFPAADQFIQPEPVEPVAPPPAKRQKFKPCDCRYCTPLNLGDDSAKSGITLQSSPSLQLQMQVDTAPKPIIVGQHALGSDIALLQQQMQIQHAKKLVQSTPTRSNSAKRQRQRSPQFTGYDGFDGRPFYGDALTYL